MKARRLLILALVFSGPCAFGPDKLLPDRLTVGVVVDADTLDAKTYNGALQWSLR